MISINFDTADKISNGLSELSSESSSVLSSCNSIDAGAVGDFSPGTVSATANIQSGVSKISTYVNSLSNNFNGSISLYREAYEEEKNLTENELKEAEDNDDTVGTIELVANNTVDAESSIIGSAENGKMLKITYEGKEYYICDSKINCLDYQEYVQSNGLTQNNYVCGDDCMVLSQYYAVDMMRGTYTSKDDMVHGRGAPAPRINDYVKSDTQDSVLKYIYDEAMEGRPTVLQVSQVDSDKGARHLVTVVGFDATVEGYKDLNADTIFVLDCVDGKLQTLSKSRASGGHERDLYKQNGGYLARGATSEFLNKEVYK